MFDIRIIGPHPDDPPEITKGRITIGSFSERFEIVLDFWTGPQYEAQWRQAVQRILNGCERSALITSMTDPETAIFFFWWPLYREGSMVHVQNQMLILADQSRPFSLTDPYLSVAERETVSEDGERISEWHTTVDEMTAWLLHSRNTNRR